MRTVNYIWPSRVQILWLKSTFHFPGGKPCNSLRFTIELWTRGIMTWSTLVWSIEIANGASKEWKRKRGGLEKCVWAIGKGEGEEEEEEKKSALFLNVGKFERKNETNEGDVVRMKDEIKICIHYPFSFPFLFLFFWKNYPLWNPVVLSFTRGTRGRIDCFI